MNLMRTWAIARNVFRETVRDRILYLLMVYVVILAGATVLVPEVALQAHDKILLDLGLASLNFLGLIVAIFVGTSLINKEIDKRTVFVLIAKPMSRAEFVVGKHLGLSALLSMLIAIMAAIFFAFGLLQTDPVPWIPIGVSILFIFLELTVVVGITLMFGVFTSSILATLYTIALYILGHLSRSLLQLGAIADNETIKRIFETIFVVLPDLERLNLRNVAVYGDLPPLTELLTSGLYAVTYTIVILVIAIFVFSRRQF
jgi:ABC-type transport system involved in multi-copper enzyme maturation permease subunit